MTAASPAHGSEPPSSWVRRWSHLVPSRATVLDVACGAGRHMRWFASRGCTVTGVDRDAAAVAPLAGIGELVIADIESGPWPFSGKTFDAIVVTNYLWRERMADVMASVGVGGVLIYETFAAGNETVGKPSNPKFLLRPGELLQSVAGLRVVAFEDGFEPGFEPRADVVRPCFVQRIVAIRENPGETMPPRHVLSPSDAR
jgi:SAM-dependent methyltransferase